VEDDEKRRDSPPQVKDVINTACEVNAGHLAVHDLLADEDEVCSVSVP
jgi:hypothetical protein